MRFIDAIKQRDCKVAGPTAHEFSLEAWEALFNRTTHDNPEDQEIFYLGVMIGWQRSRIRDTLLHLGTQVHHRSLPDMARRLVHDVNAMELRAMGSYEAAFKSLPAIAADQMAAERCFVDGGGHEHTPRGAMEATIDATAAAVGFMAFQKGFGSRATSEPEEPFDAVLSAVMQMAHHWVAAKRSWDAALWLTCDMALHPHLRSYAVDEAASVLAKEACKDLARRDARYARRDDGMADGGQHPNLLIPVVRFTQEEGIRITVGALSDLSEEASRLVADFLTHGTKLQEPTLGALLPEVHPNVGLTIEQMMGVWVALTCIALQIRTHARQGSAAACCLASVVSRSELIMAIAISTRVQPELLDKCLTFMTHGQKKHSSLWDAPLVAVGQDLALLWMPLHGASHARLLAAWCKSAPLIGQRFGEKGRFNEKLLTSFVQGALASGPLAKAARVCGSRLKIPVPTNEEIDLLLLVDKTLFVIETASLPHPAEAYEYWDMDQRLAEKRKQCVRQCQLFGSPDEATRKWMQDLGLPVEGLSMVGVVATNSFLWEGRVQGTSPCFVHIQTLIDLLRDGESQFGSLGPNGEAITFHTQCLAKAGLSTGDAVAAALRNPPKAQAYGKGLAMQAFHLPQLDETDIEGVHRAWIFKPTRIEDMAGLIESLDCAGRIVRTVD